jgi:hypothetical protein
VATAAADRDRRALGEALVANKVRVHQQLSREGTLAPTKGAKPHRRDPRDVHPIDLMPAARRALLELFIDDLAETGFVFRDHDGGPRKLSDIARAFATVVDTASLPETEDGKVTFHSLRHTALSRLANHPQIPLVYVRDFASHASLKRPRRTSTRSSRPRRRRRRRWRWPARPRHMKPEMGRTERECEVYTARVARRFAVAAGHHGSRLFLRVLNNR